MWTFTLGSKRRKLKQVFPICCHFQYVVILSFSGPFNNRLTQRNNIICIYNNTKER